MSQIVTQSTGRLIQLLHECLSLSAKARAAAVVYERALRQIDDSVVRIADREWADAEHALDERLADFAQAIRSA